MKRLFSLLLALVLLVGSFPMAAQEVSAEAPAETYMSLGKQQYKTKDSNYPDNDELFAGYTDSVFYGDSATYNKTTGKLQVSKNAMYASAAGNRLTGNTKKLYDALVPVLKEIAEGKRASATILIGNADVEDNSGIDLDAIVSFTSGDYDINLLHDALLADLPYEQYWYDKTIGVWHDPYVYTNTEQLALVIFDFTVDKFYRASANDDFTVDTSKTGAATAAAANARQIVSTNKSKTDYQKLVAYRDAICDRVEYDYNAASSGGYSINNNPWQMIYAFDNDPSTNIVCEGYSKAYMYLCDQSDFAGNVTCYTVTGNAGGPHMWNVVTIGGKNYLVDITNSDSGSIGQNGGLFLAGGSGSVTGGYSFMNGRMYFYYDNDTTNLWGTGSSSILKLSSTDYTPSAELKISAQPKSVCIAGGKTAAVAVTATGDNLKYQWYYKDPGKTTFSKTSCTTSRYALTMAPKYAGRQLYCVITDGYGNTVKSNTVTMYIAATITSQPKNVCVAGGKTAAAAVEAAGEGLTYQWYYKDLGKTTFSKTSCTTSRYALTMAPKYAGRQIYCVVTDRFGKTAVSNTVTLNQSATITSQPKSVYIASGKTAAAAVTAVGAGLTYQWYYKDPGKTTFSKTSCTTSRYALTMGSKYAGRQIYCVITDRYGNTAKSNTVTLHHEVAITTQPTSVTVAAGSTARVTVKAVGSGLTYRWYCKAPSGTSFVKSSCTSNSYGVIMSSTVAGRQAYCIITDQFGRSVKTNVVTLEME